LWPFSAHQWILVVRAKAARLLKNRCGAPLGRAGLWQRLYARNEKCLPINRLDGPSCAAQHQMTG